MGVFVVLALAGGATAWYAFLDREAVSDRMPPWLTFFRDKVTGEGPPASSMPLQVPQGTPVEAAEVEVGPVERQMSAIGTLRANESVTIRPENAARIVSIHFAEGDPVEKGSQLVSLDDSILKAELRQAETSYELSRKNYERALELFQRSVGTERTRDEAFARMKLDEANVVLARARLDKTLIRAPFAGIIGLRKVSVGDLVAVGQDLVNLDSIDPLKVDFRVPELVLPLLRSGQRIEIQVDAYPGETFAGTVYAIDPRLDPETRSIAIRAHIPNADRRLRPGLFARVALTVSRQADALLVPEQAVVPIGATTFVFRIVDGVAVRSKVVLGVRSTGKVQVREGLKPGDVVVTAGQDKLQDGALVVRVASGAGN